MNKQKFWHFSSDSFWPTIAAVIAIALASYIGIIQNEINKSILNTQDVIELYTTIDIQQTKNILNKTNDSSPLITTTYQPIIKIQNVGTRLVYIDKYIFNGRTYSLNGQVLPPSYSNANAFYCIELPTNGEGKVSLEVVFIDLEKRKWISKINAYLSDKIWKAETLPREKFEESN